MAKSERRASEGVDDAGVYLAVVLLVVAIPDRQDVQLVHEVSAKHDRQPLVVGDVL